MKRGWRTRGAYLEFSVDNRVERRGATRTLQGAYLSARQAQTWGQTRGRPHQAASGLGRRWAASPPPHPPAPSAISYVHGEKRPVP